MNAATKLRAASTEDLASIRALLSEAHLPLHGVDEGLLSGSTVAFAGGRLVGCAAIERHGPYGLLRSVAVRADLRGTGLGKLLVEERLARARASKLDKLYLLTETAGAFFTRLGFRSISREDAPEAVRASSEFRSICPSTATAMALSLAPFPPGDRARVG